MKPGRNELCVCGSGKKYKKCCQEKLEARSTTQDLGIRSKTSTIDFSAASPTKAEFDQLMSLFNTERNDEAEVKSRTMLQHYPNFGPIWKILGLTLRKQGKDSLQALQRAVELLPQDAETHFNLSTLFYAQGKFMLALNSIIQSLKITETAANKGFFVTCVKQKQFGEGADFVRENMVRALTEPWGNPAELAEISALLIKSNPTIEKCVILAIRSKQQRLSAQDLFLHVDLIEIASDKLLVTLLGITAVCDIDLERLLTTCREALLDAAFEQQVSVTDFDERLLDLYSALARQCFINEYVFAQGDDELHKINALRDKLVTSLEVEATVSPLCVLAVAAYFPLCSLPHTAKLLEMQWHEAIQSVLIQQVIEPLQELQERENIPCLTDVDDEVSLLVQAQYEENPYPRWVSMAPAGNAMTLGDKLLQLFPFVTFKPIGNSNEPEILLAGCGTGLHSISVTQKFIGARTLAIDLSKSSLSYAKRKTQEMGLNSIEYAQADIMKLGALERRFDFVESCGVLHHLADPWAGWRILLPLLRPRGIMKLGFYSELARREIVKTRGYIADRGYGSSPEEIRLCRQEMMASRGSGNFARIFRITDFYSTSECRDLLFHVQEHRMTIPEIKAFLIENKLAFLGFEIRSDYLQAYKQRFPDDRAAINLDQWHTFEKENPDTFIGMYNFWIQKA